MDEIIALSKKERINKIKLITNDIINIPDLMIHQMYQTMHDAINPLKKKNKDNIILNRFKKVQFIKNNLENLEDKYLISIEIMTRDDEEEKDNKKAEYKIIALELINKLLVAINKEEIAKLDDFGNILREEMVNEKLITVFNENKKHLIDNGFDDLEFIAYDKNLKYPHIRILKSILNKVGFQLISKNRTKTIKGKRVLLTVYFIQNNENI